MPGMLCCVRQAGQGDSVTLAHTFMVVHAEDGFLYRACMSTCILLGCPLLRLGKWNNQTDVSFAVLTQSSAYMDENLRGILSLLQDDRKYVTRMKGCGLVVPALQSGPAMPKRR